MKNHVFIVRTKTYLGFYVGEFPMSKNIGDGPIERLLLRKKMWAHPFTN
jgi:hypothetical protein